MNLEFIFEFHSQVCPALGVLISYFGSYLGLGSTCVQSFVEVVGFLLHMAVCHLIYAQLKGFCNCLPTTVPPCPLCSCFFPCEVSYILLGRKALLEIAYFINCLVTQRGWMLYSCLIYFENFATELTLINELSVVSNKLCVGYIDWEGF